MAGAVLAHHRAPGLQGDGQRAWGCTCLSAQLSLSHCRLCHLPCHLSLPASEKRLLVKATWHAPRREPNSPPRPQHLPKYMDPSRKSDSSLSLPATRSRETELHVQAIHIENRALSPTGGQEMGCPLLFPGAGTYRNAGGVH